ncbi:MAG: menaquinone biosynthesis protein [Phaeodactylibacter sp.]|nr:menaquinone biosynthesis protein [Phaeodactylibacter sp.]
MDKIRLTAVSYLNTKPLLYGLLNSPLASNIDLELNIPAVCAQKLITGRADLALVPVAVLPELETPHVISDFCIGTVGAVKTVCIYSDVPIEEAQAVYLDHHSRTSVQLTRILLQDYWQCTPALLPAKDGYIDQIGGQTAGLVIGDRTIGLEKRFKYVYDLGEIWMKHTGLPFVFAAWISNQELPAPFVEQFNVALAKGVDQIDKLKYLLPSPHPDFSVEEYFTKYISYTFDEPKRRALKTFLSAMALDAPVVSVSGL